MELLFKYLLIIHIISGALSLIAGTIVMLLKKGDRRHKLLGKTFAISMLISGSLSLALAIIHPNTFLFAVGIFTIYLTASAWRYLKLKNLEKYQKALWIDWALSIFIFLGSLWQLYLGVITLINKESFGIILLLFAWRGLSFAYQDYKTYRGQIDIKNFWLLYHLQRMSGAYIASLTAFLVVNANSKISFVAWLLPSAIVVPFIVKWSRKYLVKK
jgi:uncharacterized membrane protein